MPRKVLSKDMQSILEALGVEDDGSARSMHKLIVEGVLPEIQRLKEDVVGCTGVGPWCIAGEPRQTGQQWPTEYSGEGVVGDS